MLDNAKVMQQEVKSFLETSRPKIDVILDNLAHVTTTTRTEVERVDATVHDLLDRLRLQVIRVDEMVTHTLDRRGRNLGEGAALRHVARPSGLGDCSGHQRRRGHVLQQPEARPQRRPLGRDVHLEQEETLHFEIVITSEARNLLLFAPGLTAGKRAL